MRRLLARGSETGEVTVAAPKAKVASVVDMPHRSFHATRRQNFVIMLVVAALVAVAAYTIFDMVDGRSHTLAARYAVPNYPESPMGDIVKRQPPINDQYAASGELFKGCPGGNNLPYPFTCQYSKQAPSIYQKDLSASVSNPNVKPSETWNAYIRQDAKKRYQQADKDNDTNLSLAWKRMYDVTRGPNDKPVAHVSPPDATCPTDTDLYNYGICMNQRWASIVLGMSLTETGTRWEQYGINKYAFFFALLVFCAVMPLYWSGRTRSALGEVLFWVLPPFMRTRYFLFAVLIIFLSFIALYVFR